MTAKQEVVWSLYASGHTVSEIARTLERSKSNVSTMLKKIRRNMQHSDEWKRKSVPCVYASSCFVCPMKDCAVQSSKALHTNMLPWDAEVHA